MREQVTVDVFRNWLERPVEPHDLLSDLEPPHHFREATFANYALDDRYPSQRAAVETLRQFARSRTVGLRARFAQSFHKRSGQGLYLDGGFGVGKTHLLASAYHAQSGRKSFLSFQELMFLVGLQGLSTTVDTFNRNLLLVIDEFELDDPANTRIATNLLGQLLDAGVSILTSSNTPPGALGEGQFSVEAFKREIGELFGRFLVVRIDGEDYRMAHRIAGDGHSRWLPLGSNAPEAKKGKRLTADFSAILSTLAAAHPIRVRRAMSRLASIHIDNLSPITDPHAALRFVYFVDKVYDDDIEFSATASVAITEVFSPSIFRGGDTKKYLRAISRLAELSA
jgi:cell division protein ZapE